MVDNDNSRFNDQATGFDKSYADEFSDLDYRPRKGFIYLKSALIVGVAVFAVIMAVLYFGNSSFLAIVEDTEQEDINAENGVLDDAEPEEEHEGEPDQNSGEELDPGNGSEEAGENEEETTDPGIADPAKLKAELKAWIVKRTADPLIILLPVEETQDVEDFFEEYDLENDNVVVYKVDSIDDEFATVLFGIPFSEWSIKAVFTWRDGKWVFLREEPV